VLRVCSPRAVTFVARENGWHDYRDWHAASVASANGTTPHHITHLAPCGLVGVLELDTLGIQYQYDYSVGSRAIYQRHCDSTQDLNVGYAASASANSFDGVRDADFVCAVANSVKVWLAAFESSG
jgi:hypothetical protein